MYRLEASGSALSMSMAICGNTITCSPLNPSFCFIPLLFAATKLVFFFCSPKLLPAKRCPRATIAACLPATAATCGGAGCHRPARSRGGCGWALAASGVYSAPCLRGSRAPAGLPLAVARCVRQAGKRRSRKCKKR